MIQEGTPGDGVNITKLEPKTDTVKIIGPSDSLEKIDKIDNIPVDVTGITKSKDIKVNVPVPDGIDSVSPKQITVHVEVDKQGDEKDAEETDASAAETKSFKNLPVSLTGQSSKYTYELLSPTSVDADVKGPKSDLDKLTKSGISLSANVENLSAGEHTVPIIINSPDSVTSTLSTKQAKVRVTAKNNQGQMMSKQIKKQVEARAIKKQSQTRELDQEQTLGQEIQVNQLIQLINQAKRLIHLKTIQIHQQIVQKLVTTIVIIKVMKILHP
ncbi:CdaR family protein [Priestia megaterium]